MQHLGPERQVNCRPGKTPGVWAWMPVTTMRVSKKKWTECCTKSQGGKVERGRRLLKSATENCVVFFWVGFWSKFWKSRKSKQKGGRLKEYPLTQNVPKRLRWRCVACTYIPFFFSQKYGVYCNSRPDLGEKMWVKNSTPSSCSALRKTFPQLFPPTCCRSWLNAGILKTQKTKRKFPVGSAQFRRKLWGEVEVHLFFGRFFLDEDF